MSGGLPSCVPLNCSEDDLPIPANATVLQLPSCGPAYQSQCTVSCDEGFTGDDVIYLCNVTSDPTMVDWVPIGGGVDVMCMLPITTLHITAIYIHEGIKYTSVVRITRR